jgi:hypothetical protein
VRVEAYQKIGVFLQCFEQYGGNLTGWFGFNTRGSQVKPSDFDGRKGLEIALVAGPRAEPQRFKAR